MVIDFIIKVVSNINILKHQKKITLSSIQIHLNHIGIIAFSFI